MHRGRRCGPIGIDFGPHLRAAQRVVDHHGRARTLVIEQAADDTATCVRALGAVRRSLGVRGRDCIACPPRSQTIVESICLPRMPVVALHAAATRELAAPPARSAELELRVIGGVAHDDPTRTETLVVGVSRRWLHTMTEAMLASGFRPLTILSHVEALARAVVATGRAASSPQVVVEVDRTGTTVMVIGGRRLAACRRLGVGGGALDRAVAEHLGVDLDAASELRRRRMEAGRGGAEVAQSVARAACEAVRPLVRQLVAAVRLSVRGFGASFRGPVPGGLVLAGSEALEPGLADLLERRCGLPAQTPDRWALLGAPAEGAGWPRRAAGSAAAVGLIAPASDGTLVPRLRAA